MTSPCDTPLTAESFKVSDKNHSEINPRGNARSAEILIKRGAQLFDIGIKTTLIKNLIELGVKGVRRRLGDLAGGNEQLLLFRFAFSMKTLHNPQINLESIVRDCHFLTGC